MSATFTEALELASWWTRYALDRAPDEPNAHPGIVGHLTAGRTQLHAAATLQATKDSL